MILACLAEHMIVIVNLLVHAKKGENRRIYHYFGVDFSQFQLVSINFGRNRIRIGRNQPNRLVSARIGMYRHASARIKKKKKKVNPRVGEALLRVQCRCSTHFAALVLQRTKFGFHGPLNGSLPGSNPIFL